MVRDAVDFFRGACLVFDEDFFWLAELDELFFFLADEEDLLCDLVGADEEVWAGNPLSCSINSATRIVVVKRLMHIGGFSLTRYDIPPHTAPVVIFGTFGGNPGYTSWTHFVYRKCTSPPQPLRQE